MAVSRLDEKMTDIKSGRVDIGEGIELHYEEIGEGRPVVFIHGLWASTRFFKRQLSAIGAHHRAIALDLRGHGRSTMASGGYTLPQFARDLNKFLERLKIDSPILVGWSMGAFVAWEHYLAYGRAGVGGLVVIDQPATDFRFPDYPEALLGLAELQSWHAGVLEDRDAFMRMVLPSIFHIQPDPQDLEWMCAEMCLAPPTVAAAVLVDQSLRDYRSMLASYDVPTLVCSGGRSAQPPSGALFLRDTLPDVRHEVFENCGHGLFWEDSERFNASVLAFIGALK
jgi:pimeloyl-ACP methyl ester carboxylesterase